MSLRHAMIAPLIAMLAPLAHAAPHGCEQKARQQAEVLMKLHHTRAGITPIEDITISPKVRVLPRIKNPGNPKHSLAVLEVWGYVGKAESRIRMIYAPFDTSECVPLGQEIIDWMN